LPLPERRPGTAVDFQSRKIFYTFPPYYVSHYDSTAVSSLAFIQAEKGGNGLGFSRRPLTAKAHVRSQGSPRETIGGRRSSGTGFSLMGYKYSKLHTHSSNTSLINVIKPKTAENFRPYSILLFYIYKTSK